MKTLYYVTFFQKIIPPILKSTRSDTDKQEDYINEYGYYGSILFSAVTKLRETPATTAPSSVGIIKTTNSSVSNCVCVALYLFTIGKTFSVSEKSSTIPNSNCTSG